MITFNELGRYGRFGNQMFQIASTIGLATKHGYEFGFPYWMNYDHRLRFGSKENIDIQFLFKHPLPLAGETDCDRFIQWVIMKLTTSRTGQICQDTCSPKNTLLIAPTLFDITLN